MMKKTTSKTGRSGKERRVGLWAVSLIVSLQVVGLVLFSMATPVPVGAKSFVVDSTVDETDTDPGDGVCSSNLGYCTLRAAIQEANALFGPDVIKLRTGLYMLGIPGISENESATGDLDITDDLTITGTGAKNTFINGGKLDRVFDIIGSTISVAITDVTIQNGLATDGFTAGYSVGGGISNESGTLTLKGINISNNAASGGDYAFGGGINNSGTLTITKSTISNNVARGNNQGAGGGISNWLTGTVTIKGNTLLSMNVASGVGANSYGDGGGIFNAGTLTFIKSTLSNNVASGVGVGDGGGIYNHGTSTVTGSTIIHNMAGGPGMGYGGGIFHLGNNLLAVQNRSKIIKNFASNLGGGVYTDIHPWSSSPDSKVVGNIPTDIEYD